jgi:uroporphyrinogen decarboxylase
MIMINPVRNPEPDFVSLKEVLGGKKKPEKIYFVELLMDEEIKRSVVEKLFRKRWVPYSSENEKSYLLQDIDFWYRMGYDYIRVSGGGRVTLSWQRDIRETGDTAVLSRGERVWVEEGQGIISSWEDFEKYQWPDPKKIDYFPYEFTAKNLPEGMQMMVCPSDGIFEVVSESLLGMEGLSYLLADEPELVKEVFKKVGEIIYSFYENVIELDNVGGFFQGDDMGYKTSTIVRPDTLRELVLPWHKKFAELAHRHDKMYWLHCCGNVLTLMDDFINDVMIDAFHSFQDVIIPVGDFMRRYPEIATLGGVDVNNLGRMEEKELRIYIQGILNQCMPGRYALGSGNSIANYIPLENYLVMLDEGVKWGGNR